MLPLAALTLLSACTLDLTRPAALDGPVPVAVVVAPLREDLAPSGLSTWLLGGADRALRERGYRVLPLAVGHDLLRERDLLQAGEPSADELAATGAALDVDAVLLVAVHRFAAAGEGPLDAADWDLTYRLLSRGGAELWRRQLRGSYRRPLPSPVDATADPFAEPPPRPFGSSGPPSFRDGRDLAAALHRQAFAELPRR